MFTAIRALSNEIHYFINVVMITNKVALTIKSVWRRKRESHVKLQVVHFPLRVVVAVYAGSHSKTWSVM